MPSSRQVRAAQNRQKDRIAVARAEQARQRRQRRIIGTAIAVVLGAALVFAIYEIGNHNSTKASVAAPAPTTTAPAITRCVGLKQPLPKGAPAMPISAGPAPTTLQTKDLKVGTGATVPAGATVSANYVGVACSTGKVFDSSYAHGGKPISFSLNSVIPGWTQGIPGMKVGGVRLLSIPAALAYGANGQPAAGIAANEPLFFVVEVAKIG